MSSTKKKLLYPFLIFSIFISLNFTSTGETYWERQLRLYGKMNLPVKPIMQSKITSCGEAVITMAYNYAHPETPLTEEKIIAYAINAGYYTPSKFPFTSPEDMVNIAERYAEVVSTGNVKTAEEGLALLKDKLTKGDPVIIDVFTRLDDPSSGAHFILVTGLAIDSKNPNQVKIYFNDSQTETNRSADWFGGEGIWNAWKNNNDVNGSGWWMVISSP